MAGQPKCFYPFTHDFSAKAGKATSIIWASYFGMWHLRESALEISELSDSPKWEKIEEHLLSGVPGIGGIDLKQITATSWGAHQARYSEFMLTEAAVLYEEWCGRLAQCTQVVGKRVKAETFQFPSGSINPKYCNWGILESAGVLNTSNFLDTNVKPHLTALYTQNISRLDSMLRWYRFFKELRNVVAHHGGIAKQQNVDTFNAANVVPLTAVGMKRNYGGIAPVVGEKLNVPLLDAVLMLGLVQRIIYAFDAKFCHTLAAEQALIDRIRLALKTIKPPLGERIGKKGQWIDQFLRRTIRIPVTTIANAENWLALQGLIKIKTI